MNGCRIDEFRLGEVDDDEFVLDDQRAQQGLDGLARREVVLTGEYDDSGTGTRSLYLYACNRLSIVLPLL